MLHPAHIGAARALLGWHQVVLARKAKVGLASGRIRRVSSEPGAGHYDARDGSDGHLTLGHGIEDAHRAARSH